MLTHPNVKINLGLNVLRKREDSYHDLETLFVPSFEYSDNLEIILADDWSETSAQLFDRYKNNNSGFDNAGSPEIVQAVAEDASVMITIAKKGGVDWNPLNDLCVKAYKLLSRDYKLAPVKIFLEKNSPVGAGLGGGSSDAAFALKMLSELFSLNLTEAELASYAAELGSDCAFFIYNRPMFGSGRGEILQEFDLPVLNELDLKLVVPEGISVSTAEAYRGVKPALPEVCLKDALLSPVENWKSLVCNDFEKSVFEIYPALKSIKDSLYEAGAVYASMSGSGSALYALFRR